MKTILIILAFLQCTLGSAANYSLSHVVYTNETIYFYECMAVTDDYDSSISHHSSIIVTESKKESKRPKFYRNDESSFSAYFEEKEIKLTNNSLILLYDSESGRMIPISEGFTLKNISEFNKLSERIEENIKTQLNKEQNQTVDTTPVSAPR